MDPDLSLKTVRMRTVCRYEIKMRACPARRQAVMLRHGATIQSLAVPPRAALRGLLRPGGRYDQAPSHGSTSPFHHSQILQIRRMSKMELFECSNGPIYI
jgi:hypothetical protein